MTREHWQRRSMSHYKYLVTAYATIYITIAASNTSSSPERVLEARLIKPCSNKFIGKYGVTGDVYDFLFQAKKDRD